MQYFDFQCCEDSVVAFRFLRLGCLVGDYKRFGGTCYLLMGSFISEFASVSVFIRACVCVWLLKLWQSIALFRNVISDSLSRELGNSGRAYLLLQLASAAQELPAASFYSSGPVTYCISLWRALTHP